MNIKNISSILMMAFLILSIIPAFSFVSNVNAGLVERQNVLEALSLAEIRVYTGNQGTIGMADAAHPSILYRLTDAKINNDNSLIGSTDELLNELAILEQSMDSMVAEDDDFNIIQEDSLTATGYKFTERVAILNEKMREIEALIPECGINNVEKQEMAISICADVIVNLEEINSLFPVVFSDSSLELAIRHKLNKLTGDIYPGELLAITTLWCWGGVTDLSVLKYCTNLQDLNLVGNNIVDITPLSGLTNLLSLELGSNNIDDITPLSGLTNLVLLAVQYNQIENITPLSGLTNLAIVVLSENPLNEEASSIIAELQARGVYVLY